MILDEDKANSTEGRMDMLHLRTVAQFRNGENTIEVYHRNGSHLLRYNLTLYIGGVNIFLDIFAVTEYGCIYIRWTGLDWTTGLTFFT